jgi:hypothetical protein
VSGDTKTLGALILLLKACPQDAHVRFDFGNTVPDGLESSRGDYAELAIGFTSGRYEDHKNLKVSEFLAELKAADGKTYTGWKGGHYTMGPSTPVWVDNPGNWSETAIVDVEVQGTYAVYLITRRVQG